MTARSRWKGALTLGVIAAWACGKEFKDEDGPGESRARGGSATGEAGDMGQAGNGADSGASSGRGSGGALGGGSGGSTGGSGNGGATGGDASGGEAGSMAGNVTGGAAGSGATGGAGGSAGSTGGAAGSTGGAMGGAGGSGGTTAGAGGSGSVNCMNAVFCEDFESFAIGAGSLPPWTRYGGLPDDWDIAADGSHVLRQKAQADAQFRAMSPYALSSYVWAGPTSIRARVKIDVGPLNSSAAMVCLRFGSTIYHYCAALTPIGVQVRTMVDGDRGDSPIWPASLPVGVWHELRLSVDAAGDLSAYLDGALMGTYTRPAPRLGNGRIAVASEVSLAAFDDVIVTQP